MCFLFYIIKYENVNTVVLWCKQNIACQWCAFEAELSVGLTSGRRGEFHFFAVTFGDNSGI